MVIRVYILGFFFYFLAEVCPAQDILAEPLEYGWSGGLNSCQFCALDLDLDGKDDLLIFDRHGNRKLTFLFQGPDSTLNYTFKPEIAWVLPEMTDWVITADYNHDGRMDLFTYHNGGARVYRNDSDHELKFTLVTDLLQSWYYNGYVGILITSVDYPAISDVDGDGDLDLLTFFGLGSWVEYHRNLSVEKYGHPDTLDFRMEDPCWGKFRESESSNRIQLNADCPYSDMQYSTHDGEKHTGSTLLATDLNGDGLKDLILGDVDFPNLIALYNGGTADSARMTSMDTLYPVSDYSVYLFSFPVVSLIDIDHDGASDLIVSPFDPSLSTAENHKSIWLYKNRGTDDLPDFVFQTDRFFQDKMLDFGSNAFPLLFDLDQDGLTDLLVSSAGYYDTSFYFHGLLKTGYVSRISWFRNEGTAVQPFFRRMTDDLGQLAPLKLDGLSISSGDLTGDGKPDLLTGNTDGTLVFLENLGLPGPVPLFGQPQLKFGNIDVGDNSTPQLFDLDQDGLTDLIIGEREGNLNYYRNTGSISQPLFQLVTDSLGKINVTNPAQSYDGYSTPRFFRTPEGKTRLAVGCEDGRIWYFTGIDGNLEGTFSASDSLPFLIGTDPSTILSGVRSAPAIEFLSDPARCDLITGNFSGGLQYISCTLHPGLPEISGSTGILRIYPNPANEFFVLSSGLLAEGERCQILDAAGRPVVDLQFSENMTIETYDLPNGYYFVRVHFFTAPLVIAHP